MELSRRSILTGATAAGLVLAFPAGAATGARSMALLRAGSRIGSKTVRVRQSSAEVAVETNIDIDVRLVGLPLYRYKLLASEVWVGGELASLRSRTDDNGTAHFVDATREGDRVRVAGSAFSGTVSGNPATTSYWSPAFLERSTWISTQDGRPLSVTALRSGSTDFPTLGGTIEATRWKIGGDIDGLELFYDRSGEWVGSEFPARGETARFVTAERGAALTPLWANA